MSRVIHLAVPLVVLALAACERDTGPQAPLYSCASADSTCNAAVYTVVLRDSVADPSGVAAELGKEHEFTASRTWQSSMKGFAAQLDEGALKKIRRDPRVAYVRQGDMAQGYATQ